MKTIELQKLLVFLKKVGPKDNPFRDECIAYVERDLAIRAQQRKDMKDMNRGDDEYFYFGGR